MYKRQVYHYAAVFLFLTDYLQGVDDTGQNDDGSTVLVIMEYGDVQNLLQTFLNFETTGSTDVFQIDSAEAGSQIGHSLDDLFGILGVQTDGDSIYITERCV